LHKQLADLVRTVFAYFKREANGGGTLHDVAKSQQRTVDSCWCCDSDKVKWSRSSIPGPPAHKTDHSPPSSAEIKNAWSYTSIPPYVLMS